jgi:hypothetical protein
MSNEIGSRVRYGEAFWRAHHEAWQQSALNQRQYCEAHGIPLKAFGNWRVKCPARPPVPFLANGSEIRSAPRSRHRPNTLAISATHRSGKSSRRSLNSSRAGLTSAA